MQVVVCQPVVYRGLALQANQQHAARSHLRRDARAQHKAGVHGAIGAIARHIDDVHAIEHAHVGDFLGARGQPLQKGLHDAGQACRL